MAIAARPRITASHAFIAATTLVLLLLLLMAWRVRVTTTAHRDGIRLEGHQQVAAAGKRFIDALLGTIYQQLDAALPPTSAPLSATALGARHDSMVACACGPVLPAAGFLVHDTVRKELQVHGGLRVDAIGDMMRRAIGSAEGGDPVRQFRFWRDSIDGRPALLAFHQRDVGVWAGVVLDIDGFDTAVVRPTLSYLQRIDDREDSLSAVRRDRFWTPQDGDTAAITLQLAVSLPDGTPLHATTVNGHRVFVSRQWTPSWPGLVVDVGLASATGRDPRLPTDATPLLIGIVLLGAGVLGMGVAMQQRAEALAAARTGFLASVTHELRTPLTLIGLTAERLGRDPAVGPGEVAEHARVIGAETNRLRHLVENALRFAGSPATAFTVECGAVPLAPLMNDLARLTGPYAEQADMSVILRYDAAPVAWADADAVRQVVVNLVDNAIRYGPRGQEITLRTGLEGGRAVIEVIDQGPGLPEGLAAGQFHQIGVATGTGDRGSGLGLAVAARLASAMGGALVSERNVPTGMRFRLLLRTIPAQENP